MPKLSKSHPICPALLAHSYLLVPMGKVGSRLFGGDTSFLEAGNMLTQMLGKISTMFSRQDSVCYFESLATGKDQSRRNF